MTDLPGTRLSLALGLDRALAWCEGKSVRYAVATLSAQGTVREQQAAPLNLALAIDASGSMAGAKMAAARRTAAAVVEALTPQDRLSIVAFETATSVLLDAFAMTPDGKRAARQAIEQLTDLGGTNLWEGWMTAAERVALAMQREPRASHRVLLLSDGHANEGVTDATELAQAAGGLLERGILTSAVGIGDGYDELLLGRMTEAGGGRLHDAEHAEEVNEVVLGELLEHRRSLTERTTLTLAVPANIRAEVVGGWAHQVRPGAITVTVGSVLADQPKIVVFRLHCPAGAPGTEVIIGAAAQGQLPDGSGVVETAPVDASLTLAIGAKNNAQRRDISLSLAVMKAWRADVLRMAVTLNRRGDRRATKAYLEREVSLLERYAKGLPDTDALLAELALLLRRAEQRFDERLSKEIYAASASMAFSLSDHRSAPRASLSERLRKEER